MINKDMTVGEVLRSCSDAAMDAVVALAGLYVLLRNYLSPPVYLAAAAALLLAGSAALFSWVRP